MKNKSIIKLYEEKANIIYKYLTKRGCSHENAEDIVQTTFSKAIEYMAYMETDNLSSWLFKVALNQYYDICRKDKKYPIIELDEQISNLFFDDSNEGIKHIMIQEEKQKVKTIFNQLSDHYKNLLLLKYEMDLSYRQISDITGMGEEKIKTYLYRARNEFKKKWEVLDNETK